MFFTFLPREVVVSCLPRGGVVVEIGVDEGDFSRAILDCAQPSQLHLIDPWVHQDRAEYKLDPANADDATQAGRYESVLARFAPEIAAGRVHVHRAFSPQAADLFADSSLDWVYIDGDHSRAAVAADLAAWAPKIKPDGFILGHDYARHTVSAGMGFGVADAVDAFVLGSGWHFAALNADGWATFVLARSIRVPAVRDMALAMISRGPTLEIHDFPARGPLVQHVAEMDGRNIPIFSF